MANVISYGLTYLWGELLFSFFQKMTKVQSITLPVIMLEKNELFELWFV